MRYLLKKSLVAYPAFSFFVAAMSATTLAGTFSNLRDYSFTFLWIGVGLLIFELICSVFRYCCVSKSIIRLIRRILIAISFFCICVFLFFLRVQENPNPSFPPSEISFKGEVLEVSYSDKGTVYGIVNVQECKYKFLVGSEVWFTFANYKKGKQYNVPYIKSGDVINVFGVIRSVVDKQPMAWGYVKDIDATRSFNKYLESRFVYFKMFANPSNVKVVSSRDEKYWGEHIAEKIDNSLSKTFCIDEANSKYLNTLKAMVLGNKANLTSQQKTWFKDTGTMHIFAVSGLHVGVVAYVLFVLLSILCIPWRLRCIVVVPILFMYILACGLPPSAVRAFLMVSTFVIAISFSRGANSLNALMLSAIIAVLIEPQVIFSAGFQLSYAVVASLLLYSSVYIQLEKVFVEHFYSVRFFDFYKILFKFFVGGLCVSIGASCVAMPISSYWFGVFSLSGVFVSPVFVMLASIAVSCAIVGVFLPSFVAIFFNTIAIFSVYLMTTLAETISNFMPILWKVKIENGFFCVVIVSSILILAILLERSNVWLRFILVPLMSIMFMLIIWM